MILQIPKDIPFQPLFICCLIDAVSCMHNAWEITTTIDGQAPSVHWCIWHVGTTQDPEDIIHSPCDDCGSQEQPPDAILFPIWSLTDVCGSLDILPTAHQKRTTTVLSLWWTGAASRLEATVRKTQPHLALGSGGRPWPTEHWPCICLEEGSYSWRLAAHCRHCNAPAEYAIKEEQEDEQADKTPNLAELGLPSHLTHM